MIKAEQIPDEVVEAAAEAIASEENNIAPAWVYEKTARAAIAAALGAWKGVQKDRVFLGVSLDGVDNRITRLCLPLPKESE